MIKFTIHFATINTIGVKFEKDNIVYLQYTLLLLIPDATAKLKLACREFTIHFATINTSCRQKI